MTTLPGRYMSIAFATMLVAALATSSRAADLILTSGFVSVDGEQIYFESTGVGETVVLTHGSGGTHAVWFQQVVVLAQKYRVITWDQRGFGRSTNAKNQAAPGASVEDLKALLDHLGIANAHLVGQSMGGWAVMGFTLKYPARVRSLVLADTIGGVFTPEAESWRTSPLAGTPPDQLPITQHPGLRDALGLKDPAKAFLYKQLGWTAPAGLSQKLRTTSYPLDDVRRISIPVLVVMGPKSKRFRRPRSAPWPPRLRGPESRCCPAPGIPRTLKLQTPGMTWS